MGFIFYLVVGLLLYTVIDYNKIIVSANLLVLNRIRPSDDFWDKSTAWNQKQLEGYAFYYRKISEYVGKCGE